MAEEERGSRGRFSMASVKAKFHRMSDRQDPNSETSQALDAVGIQSENGEPPPWHTGLEQEVCGFSLSFKARLYGFLICLAIGVVISFVSIAFVGQADKFAIAYTIGNIVAILASGFLVGPLRQFKLMFAPTRFVAAIIFFAMMGLTLWVALDLKKQGLCILTMFFQFLALVWYGFSFVPYLRTLILNTITCGQYSEWVKACGCGEKKKSYETLDA